MHEASTARTISRRTAALGARAAARTALFSIALLCMALLSIAAVIAAPTALAQVDTEDRVDTEVDTEDRVDTEVDTEDRGVPPTTDEALEADEPDELAAGVIDLVPSTCAGRARAVALDAVVRVRSGNEWGTGFVYRSRRHVVTAYGLVALGRPATVVTRSGNRLSARVVARDEAFGIAVLETDADVPRARALSPAPETSAMVGQPAVALGHPSDPMSFALGQRGEGLLRWSVSQGLIGAVNAEGLQADLTLRPGHAGAPLLDCDGRVLGAVGTGGLGPGATLAARAQVIDAALRDAEPTEDFFGSLRLRFGIGALLYIDDGGRVAAGGYLTVGATLFDRLSWMNRVGLLVGINEPADAADLAVERRLIRVESMLGWRFFVDIGGFTTLYIVPSVGLSVVHQTQTRRSVQIEPVPACVPTETEACVRPRIVESSTASWHARPALGLTVIVGGGLEVAYTFELDVEDPISTFHAVHLGLAF